MQQYLDPNKKTLIIAPSKYHNKIYQDLLVNNNIIFNVSILNIETFLLNTMQENNIDLEIPNNLINKLELSLYLKTQNHQYYNNVNYLSELYKLKNEFIASNVTIPTDMDLNISFEKINFSNIKVMYDRVIIYTYEDFTPIHYELLSNINVCTIEYKPESYIEHQLYEHNNIIRMLDYIIYDIYQKDNYNEILIVCDDLLQQDYLTDKLDLLNIPYQLENENLSLKAFQIKSLFNYLNKEATPYDLLNINTLTKDKEINLNNLNDLSYLDYLKELYHVLVELSIFDLNFLNKTFSQLFLLDSIDINLLNNYLLESLQKNLTNNTSIKTNSIFIATSSYNSLHFKEAYLLDASFNNLSPQKASYLLNTKQRYDIDKTLIANPYYAQDIKNKQDRLLQCADTIYIHYALINLDNKPQSLAFFIDRLGIQLSVCKNYSHLIKQDVKANSPLLSNKVEQLNNKDILKRYNEKVNLSATSLDSFFLCPYQYFISYILKPKSSDCFSYLHTGTLNHEIMERINIHLIENNLSYENIDENILDDIIEEVLQTNLSAYKVKYQLNDYDLIKVYRRTKDIMHTNLTSLKYFASLSDYKLDQVEQNLSFPIQHNQISNAKLVGKIDLTMRYNDYYYIVDYKSSTKSFNETNFINGLSNQLIVYLSLLNKQGCNLTGAFFKPIKDNYEKSDKILEQDYNLQIKLKAQMLDGLLIDNPTIENFDYSFKTNSSSQISTSRYPEGRSKGNIKELDKILEYLDILEQHCNDMLDSIAKGNFPILPYEKTSCTYCDYKNICKVNDFSLTRKELESHE